MPVNLLFAYMNIIMPVYSQPAWTSEVSVAYTNDPACIRVHL